MRFSAFAVFRLITNSNFVGCSTGNSTGFTPFRILSTYQAARRQTSRSFAELHMRPPPSTHALVSYADGSRFLLASSVIRCWYRLSKASPIVMSALRAPWRQLETRHPNRGSDLGLLTIEWAFLV